MEESGGGGVEPGNGNDVVREWRTGERIVDDVGDSREIASKLGRSGDGRDAAIGIAALCALISEIETRALPVENFGDHHGSADVDAEFRVVR